MRALTTLILQFVIKAWNFENFIIISQETIFLTKTFCTVTWLLTPAFFRLQNVFFQTMSNYIPLELQFTADQSFFQNYDLKMHGFQDTEGQSPRWRYRFSEVFFFFFFLNMYEPIYCWNRNLMQSKVSLKPWMIWTCMVFNIQWFKVNDDVIIFQTDVLIFPNMSIYIPWILHQSKFSWNSDTLFKLRREVILCSFNNFVHSFKTKYSSGYGFAFSKI